MPDPTPTPDTLRAAIDSLGESARAGLALSPARQVVLRGLLIDAYAARAALAASPAPTDNPDERPCTGCGCTEFRCWEATRDGKIKCCPDCRHDHRPAALPPDHGEWLPDAGTYEDGATEQQRRDEVRATTCRRLGHHWTPGGVCDRCGDPRHTDIEPDREMGGVACSECGWHLAGAFTNPDEQERMHDEAQAATAPREDERADLRRQVLSKMTARRSQHWHGADTLLLRYEAALTVPREGPMSNNGPLTATNRADASHNDNAVERATPDPDPDTQRRVLAGKLLDLIAGLVVNSPDELIDFCNDAARHLVSTGVTVNEPAAGQ